MGLLRNAVLASTFGTGQELDAYFAAFRLPDAIFQLVVGAALASAFIPYFTAKFTNESSEAAWRLASAVLTWFTLAGAVIAGIGFLAAPWLVPWMVHGFPPETQELTVQLTRVMLASSVFFCASVVLTGVLNARYHFALPAVAPLLYNLSIIAGTLWLVEPMGVFGPAWGVTIGAALHLLVQVPALQRIGMRYTLLTEPRSAGVGDVLRLMGPRVLSLASLQVNWLVMIFLASTLGSGSITALSYAWAVTMLPLSLVGMAPATAAFPTLAYTAAKQDWVRYQRMITTVLRLVFFVAIPASIGLALVRYPLVKLLFERGNFDARSTQLTSSALLFFALGLLAHVTLEVASRGFYALQNTRTPLFFAVVGMVSNAGLSFLLIGSMGTPGLALASTLSVTLEATGLLLTLAKGLGGLDWSELAVSAAKTSGATLVMGMTVYALMSVVQRADAPGELVLTLVGAGTLGGCVFLATAALLRSSDLAAMLHQLRTVR